MPRSNPRGLWPFSKPKTPGFGISRDFYLSILMGVPRLPSLLALINPQAEGGAVKGFGAPLSPSTDKSLLAQPMERGGYALASYDQKTVLKMLILPRDEAGFDPELIAKSPFAGQLSSEILSRVRATWTIAQLTFEAHDPMVTASLEFLLRVSERLGTLTEGVVADPISEVYKLPHELFAPEPPSAPIDARNFVNIRSRTLPEGEHVFTLGLRKFALAELEMQGVPTGFLDKAQHLLLMLAQKQLSGDLIEPGDWVGAKSAPLAVAPGGLDRGLWDGIPCFELIPAKKQSLEQCLLEWLEN